MFRGLARKTSTNSTTASATSQYARVISEQVRILLVANPRYRTFANVAVVTIILYILRLLIPTTDLGDGFSLVSQESALQADIPAAKSRHDVWLNVITQFLDTVPPPLFATSEIKSAHAKNMSRTCVLVEVDNGNVTINHDGLRRDYLRAGRYSSVKYMLDLLVKRKQLSGIHATFLVDVSDGTRPPVATFVSAKHWLTWPTAIPIPLGNPRGYEGGTATPLEGWDAYVKQWITDSHSRYPFDKKINQAVFRGCLRVGTSTLGSCNSVNNGRCINSTNWSQVNRGVMYVKAMQRPDLFDIQFTSILPHLNKGPEQLRGAPSLGTALPFQDFQKYKLVLNVGSNQDWAERERSLFFMNSVVVHHMAETQEFFTPLLKPWENIVPVSLDMSDLLANVHHVLGDNGLMHRILENQHAFAKQYLSQQSMEEYWALAISEFAKRQFKQEPGITSK